MHRLFAFFLTASLGLSASASAAPVIFDFNDTSFARAPVVSLTDTTGRFGVEVSAGGSRNALVTPSGQIFTGLGVDANPQIFFDDPQIDNRFNRDFLDFDFGADRRLIAISFNGLGALGQVIVRARVGGNVVSRTFDGAFLGNLPNPFTVQANALFGPNAVVSGFRIVPPEIGLIATRFRVAGVVIDAPEPATLGLIFGGLAAVGFYRRRQNTALARH